MTEAQQEFARRVRDKWLPDFCESRGYDPAAYDPAAKFISDVDARDFLRAVDAGVAFFNERQRMGMSRGAVCDPLFTEGEKKIQPRPVYLWVETVLTVAAGGRLHFQHGWPADLLAMQPTKDYAFDLAAYQPPDFSREFIAAEIKPTLREFNALSGYLRLCCAGQHDETCTTKKARINAHRKWSALAGRRPPLLWLVGPSPSSEVFRLSYAPDGAIEMQQVEPAALHYRP